MTAPISLLASAIAKQLTIMQPSTLAKNGTAMETGIPIRAIEFPEPGKSQVVTDTLATSKKSTASSTAIVETLYTAVSPGTELLAYRGQMPDGIPTDASFATQQAAFSYPCRYGYCAVGMRSQPSRHTEADSELNTNTENECHNRRVFAFREHVSAFEQPAEDLLQIPSDVDTIDATFLPAFETAISLISDAALTPGDRVCVVGQGLVGLIVTAVLNQLAPFSRVVTTDIRLQRREKSLANAYAYASIDAGLPEHVVREQVINELGCAEGADVTIELSGCAAGLDCALNVTRDYGRVVIGSWYGAKDMVLTQLGGSFHRSHVTLVPSQVSHVHAALAPRWSKGRRFDLAWRLLKEVKPISRFDIPVVLPSACCHVYELLEKGEILAAVFKWTTSCL